MGGVHPQENKLSASEPIVVVDLPKEVTLFMNQHIGAPAKPIVKKGDHVKRGDIVAEPGGFVSAQIHSPISGEVVSVGPVKNSNGVPCEAITIKSDMSDAESDGETVRSNPPARTDEEIAALEPEQIVGLIKDAGIVGLGGATFPTHVKLSPPPGNKAELLIINAVECEPYLTNDHALMLAYPDEIIEGVRLLRRAAKVDKAVIGIENNKPDAIALLNEHLAGADDIEVVPLKVKYPQGGEKQLIEAVMGREVPSGALPISVGAIVQNVATAYAVHRAIRYDEPLMGRIVTVTGPGVKYPGNYFCTIGRPISSIIDKAGGLPEDTAKVILGGPMMGRTAANLDAPTTKGVSGILILGQEEARRREVQPCIRCGACVDVCPMGLEPFLVSTLSRLGRWEDAENEKVMNCIECGSCSFICPASRPLLDYIRIGKMTVGAAMRARAQQKK